MTLEFVITCASSSKEDILDELADSLIQALDSEYGQDEFNEYAVDDMIQLKYERVSGSSVSLGFSIIELPLLNDSVIDDFTENLSNSSYEFHVVKFEDPFFQRKLSDWAKEIFEIEMKLRRVLSFVYLYRYADGSPYELFIDERIRPMEDPSEQQMKAAYENQFFHLLFSHYIQLNERPRPALNDLLQFIHDFEEYDALHRELIRVPIENENDANLLNDIKIYLDPIEKMRNCVAHNRRPPRSVLNNYPNARLRLDELLEQYMKLWELEQ